LVVTISLMVLVMIISVGVLSLSAIAMRAGKAASAQQEARANARLALLLAIGNLQQGAGPDQRITAPAAHVDPNAPRALTGVWRSHEASSDSPSVDSETQFERWLISHPTPTVLENGQSVPTITGNKARLIGPGSLGPNATPKDELDGSIIETDDGGLAYAVLDESGKARIDLTPHVSPYGEVGLQANLGEARRFGIEAIDKLGQGGFQWWDDSGQDRLISLNSGRLLQGAPEVNEFSNDLTAWSRGLLTDTARGGMRGDLSVMFEKMPADYARARVYTDPEAQRSPANPYWSLLESYSTTYKEVSQSGDGGYQVTAAVPRGHRPYRKDSRTGNVTPTLAAMRGGYPLMPVVTKLEMVFSIFSKNAHGGWGGYTEDWYIGEDFTASSSRRTHSMMPIEFDGMRIGFDDIPIGFNYYVSRRPQLNKMAHFNQLYISNDLEAAKAKRFELILQNDFSSSGSPGKMMIPPGETIVFGNSADPNKDWHQVFDWRSTGAANSRTIGIEVVPGWSEGVGYIVDWLTPNEMLTGYADKMGILSMRRQDTIDIEFGPMKSTEGTTNFVATVDIVTGRRSYPAGVIEMEYGSQENLTKVLTDQVQNKSGRDEFKLPQRFARPRNTMEVYEFDDTPLKEFKRILPFALFSFRNKATVESGTASRPGATHPPTQLISSMDFETEDPAVFPFEAWLAPFEDPRFNNERGIQIDGNDRGYGFTGHSLATGVRSFPLHELPVLPPQSVAQLRHAQLASSGHLPGFTYTVGESWAHPMIPSDEVITAGNQGYDLIDHTWLANNELWDSWFYSTICGYEGVAFGGSAATSMTQVLSNFLDGTRPLLNTRLSPHIPSGTDASTLATELSSDPEFYRKSARYLWVEGPFNVNSVSKEAWKALLSSLNKCEVPNYDALSTGGGSSASDVENPFPRQRRPAGPAVNGGSSREQRWRGFRTLEESEIEQLAQAIVEVVKERGPFLSLADFVNRKPGRDTETALRGALQEAIDRSGVNDIFSANPANADQDCRDIPLAEVQADGFAFPEAIAGKNAQGAPSYLSQGDILSALGTTVAARGDTFRIRAYGESRNGNQVAARAWCEAVVQRTHSFVDPTDEPETAIDSLTKDANKKFGRRFEIVAFRWLAVDEV